MTDPRPCPNEPDGPTGTPALSYLGYTIQLQQMPLERMAVITQPNQRPAIVLATDRGQCWSRVGTRPSHLWAVR